MIKINDIKLYSYHIETIFTFNLNDCNIYINEKGTKKNIHTGILIMVRAAKMKMRAKVRYNNPSAFL